MLSRAIFSVRCECIEGVPETNDEVNERKSIIRLLSCKSKRSSSKHIVFGNLRLKFFIMNYLSGRLVSLNCKCQWSNWRIGQNGAFENCIVEFARYK